jgi:toxin ParE1/3/4
MSVLHVLPEARDDVALIWAYLADARSAETADRVTRHIERAYDQLAAFPESGRAREDIGPDARSIAVRPYVVVYRIRPGIVEIMRVYHGAQSPEPLYPSEPVARGDTV